MLKIARQLKKDGIRPDKMLESSFTAMDLEFTDIEKADKCLEIEDQGNEWGSDVYYKEQNNAM